MMDGWLTMREQHGLKAICKMRDGVPVAVDVNPVDARKLLAWLQTRPDLSALLWDEAEDERADIPERECGGSGVSDMNRLLDTPINNGFNADTARGKVQQCPTD